MIMRKEKLMREVTKKLNLTVANGIQRESGVIDEEKAFNPGG